jgi:hypothetical protein
VGSEKSVIGGALTPTCTVAVPVCTKPGALACTVAVPPVSGSSSMPPPATVFGESKLPGAIVTVRGVPGPALVTSRATAGVLFVTVTTIEVPPARIA